ncbi:hypothetical protein N7V53_01470 [Kosakonia sp. HypNH10]|jgi:hypothetical protein|uniref:hypothetical protein n=1 Tax=Kosakonia sp. HypNH10 TaxID=2980101 RepID=UPI00244AF540|nr:hypothetical protein [Kosakonia sp. HypNH10]MDH2911207.1 hypothetical protein [Kosakonia sp. HypNH10]
MTHPLFSISGLSPSAQYVEIGTNILAVEQRKQAGTGSMLLIAFMGRRQIARLCGASLITEEGEAIEGDALDDVEMLGVVTHIIRPAAFDDYPVM